MVSPLKVSLIQQDIVWQDESTNLSKLTTLINGIKDCDIILLPEMFTTGFSMSTDFADKNKKVLNWMLDTAKKENVAVAGSVMIEEDSNFFNRFYFVTPEGQYWQYDKKHLFRMATEDQHYVAGKERLIFEYKGWRICPLICYDLRFPVWSRNLGPDSKKPVFDLLIYVANWPKKRSEAWKTLLSARAIENSSYVIGLNRVGSDANGHIYNGDSGIISAEGQWLVKDETHEESVLSFTLDFNLLSEYRKNFPTWMDADNFSLL